MESLTSTKYWLRKINLPTLTATLFSKQYAFISKAPFSTPDKMRLLKAAWNITGTNRIRSQYVIDVQNICIFFEKSPTPANKMCQTSSLYEILYDCNSVKSFIEQLKGIEAFSYFGLDFSKESRFFFQPHQEFSRVATFIHKCINLYLLYCNYIKLPPSISKGLLFLIKLVKSAICTRINTFSRIG